MLSYRGSTRVVKSIRSIFESGLVVNSPKLTAIDSETGEEREIVSRMEATRRGLPRFFTGEPCVHGHTTTRYTSDTGCYTCNKIHRRAWSNTDRGLENSKKRQKLFKENNPDYWSTWAKDNPDKIRAKSSNYRAAKTKQTPAWADRAKIQEVYTTAISIEIETGVKQHVDHIVALKPETDYDGNFKVGSVCGLHVHYNLAVFEDTYNMGKSNKFCTDLYETHQYSPADYIRSLLKVDDLEIWLPDP